MGNNQYKYIHYNITEQHKKDVLNKKILNYLEQVYNQFSQRDDFLSKENFNKIVRIDDDKILDKVFDIFKYQKEKMYFSELINFYVSFANKKLKYILLSFFIMGNHGHMDQKIYIDAIADLINIDDKFKKLCEKNSIEQIIKKEKSVFFPDFKFPTKKNEEERISKEFLVQFLEKDEIKFSFYQEIKPSSEYFKQKRKNSFRYVCDCKMDYSQLNKNMDKLDTIEASFYLDKLIQKRHLSFKNFEKIMKEFKVNEKLINLIIKYLKVHTMKDSINFNDFKDIISYVYDPNNLIEKKKLLFKMILTIHNQKNSIKGTQLKKFFQIDNKECNLEEKINEIKFGNLNEPIILSKIREYVEYMENLGLLPYVRYNLGTIDKTLQKKIINFMLNNKTAEQYLIENFDKCDKFYPINIEFWNSLTNKDSSDEQPEFELKINNSLIAEKEEIYYITKEEEEKNEIKKIKKENKKIEKANEKKKKKYVKKKEKKITEK